MAGLKLSELTTLSAVGIDLSNDFIYVVDSSEQKGKKMTLADLQSAVIDGILKTDLVGDGNTTSFDIAHTFGTRDIAIQVSESFGDYEVVHPSISMPTTTSVRVEFNIAPAVSENYRVIIRKF